LTIDPFRYALGLAERFYLPAFVAAFASATSVFAGCDRPLPSAPAGRPVSLASVHRSVFIESLTDRVQSWRIRSPSDELRGLRLLYDTPLVAGSTLAVVHSIVRSNHRLDPFDALVFAVAAASAARGHRLDAGFYAAVLLQESSFSPDALSASGAVGIAQFTLDTASDEGVNPFDWSDAMSGSAALLGRYVAAYDGIYPDPYAAALAAYNAGPGTVGYYHGVPPYPETRAYIADIYDRWARIEHDALGSRFGKR
jgi:hypothetical protein